METESRMQSSLVKKLLNQPEHFNFFQAVCLLEKFLQLKGVDGPHINFKALSSFSFPSNSIAKITEIITAEANNHTYTMQVACMGLTGVNGVMPKHYTEFVLARIQEHDYALRDFLDLFNQRLISLFYQAWQRSRVFVRYPAIEKKVNKRHLITQTLLSLTGNGLPIESHGFPMSGEVLCYYAGYFSRPVASMTCLENLLNDYFSVTVKIVPYQQEKLKLANKDRSRLCTQLTATESFNRLGLNIVVGRYSTIVQGKIRLRIGPLSYTKFLQFLPNGDALKALVALVRYYIDLDLVFDIQLILRADETPRCQLRSQQPFRLGWSTWLYQQPLKHESDQLILYSFIAANHLFEERVNGGN